MQSRDAMLLIRVSSRYIFAAIVLSYIVFILVLSRTHVREEKDRSNALALRRLRRALDDSTFTTPFHNLSIRASSLRFIKPLNDNYTSLPPPHERAPNFIIVGSQKCGTTALNTYLSQHPLIEIPTEYKEPHFFDLHFPDKSPKENLNTYIETYFLRDCRRARCIAGESTPIYLYDTPVIPPILNQTCPWVKFLVLLRDPVKRLYSHHNMMFNDGFLDESFEKHLEDDFHWMEMVGLYSNKTLSREEEHAAWNRYLMHPSWDQLMIGRGLYEIQLREWFRYFERRQFLILKSQELDNNRDATMKKVYDFLGVPYQPLAVSEKVHVRNYTKPMPSDLEARLYDFYRPYNKRLERLLGPDWKEAFDKKL
jgi:hypothetical protein